jgi:RNA recognition motif-containing protein
MNIFVSNLNFKMTEEKLKEEFEQFGDVSSAKIIKDRESGRSKGFGFVEMANAEEANEAIKQLNGCDIDGRTIVVNEARPKPATHSK